MKFVKEHKMTVILTGCTVLVIAVLIYFGTHTSSPTAVEDAAMTTVTPVQKFFGNIGRGLYDVTHCIGEISELRNQNNELSQKNADLENRTAFNSELMEENDRLKRMLELRRELENDGYEMTACTVVANEPSNWFASFTIDKGRNSGVEVGQPVITSDKLLVGKITRVGNNWAEVMTIVDPGFSAGAKIKRSNHMGVAEGDSNLREKRQLRLSYLNRETDIEPEDIILTSGLGGVFPDGFKIGRVLEINEDTIAASRYAILEPLADLKNLREVFVITNNLDIVADRENDNMKAAREEAEAEQTEIDKKTKEQSQSEDEKRKGSGDSDNSEDADSKDSGSDDSEDSDSEDSGSSDDEDSDDEDN